VISISSIIIYQFYGKIKPFIGLIKKQLKIMPFYAMLYLEQSKKQGGWLILRKEAGRKRKTLLLLAPASWVITMSNFEIILVIFGSITIVFELIRLMIHILDIFSQRK